MPFILQNSRYYAQLQQARDFPIMFSTPDSRIFHITEEQVLGCCCFCLSVLLPPAQLLVLAQQSRSRQRSGLNINLEAQKSSSWSGGQPSPASTAPTHTYTPHCCQAEPGKHREMSSSVTQNCHHTHVQLQTWQQGISLYKALMQLKLHPDLT